MTLEQALQQALNGLSFGALLFVLAAGLSLIFGMMDVVNLAHGAFYMLGAYVALSVTRITGSFWIALLVAPLVLGLLGLVIEPLLLRRLRGRHLDQVLVTIGLSLVIVDFIRLRDDWGWGATVRSLPFPAGLDHSIPIAGSDYPVYRLFVIGFGIALAVVLALVHRRSRIGALVRAGVGDAQMLSALGVDTDRLFTVTFAIGAALAGLAGVIAAPVFGLQPGMDTDALIYSLIVVVIGGLGSLGGAVAGSAVVGPGDTFGKVLVPQFALALIFAIMALVLLFRPTGLLGRIRIGR
ncbi:MAG TPA: branched-chain amino acid ABC transporter permease [Candidatus Limnocylindria bacterium]|nr:branched-chain amino acid ABC transporter permease [Candidatus Limnocylindria bacterium]